MRALLPDLVTDVDVHAFYARDWVDRGGVRVNFVASADGGAHANGKSRGLQTPGDNMVFAALRDLADVVLVGSGTANAEGYRTARLSPERRRIRSAHGLPPELPIAITTRSLNLDPASPVFAAGESGPRTLVLTCAAADSGRRRALARVADVIVCGQDAPEPALVRRELQARGLTRILSEGGPTAFAELAAGGVVDELCLSLSPMLVGPGAGRIVSGAAQWPVPRGLELAGLLEDDGALFLRYLLGPRDHNT